MPFNLLCPSVFILVTLNMAASLCCLLLYCMLLTFLLLAKVGQDKSITGFTHAVLFFLHYAHFAQAYTVYLVLLFEFSQRSAEPSLHK